MERSIPIETKVFQPFVTSFEEVGQQPQYLVQLDEETSIKFAGESKAKVLAAIIGSTRENPRTEASIIAEVYANDSKFSLYSTNPFANRLSVRVNTINRELFKKNGIPDLIHRISNGKHRASKETFYFLEKSLPAQQVFPPVSPQGIT